MSGPDDVDGPGAAGVGADPEAEPRAEKSHGSGEAGVCQRPPLSRRSFLAGLGAAVATAVVGGYAIETWERRPATRGRRTLAAGSLGAGVAGRTLVVVELGGGNDGLNTVVPMADPIYRTLRPTMGVAHPLALDAEIGLEPRLAALARRYHDGHVAIVEGIGYPDPDLSHFGSLAQWWTAVGPPSGSGWLGRYLDGTVGFDDPLAGVSLGPSPSAAMLGDASFSTSVADATGLRPRLPAWVDSPDDLLAAWEGFAPARVDPMTLVGRVQGAFDAARDSAARLDAALGVRSTAADAANTGEGLSRGTRRGGMITSLLGLAAELASMPQPPRVIYVNGTGDFDTHQGEAQRHPALMADLDAGIDGFFTRVQSGGRSSGVALMTVSEFGRRAHENGSGTDHGTAAPHFVVGPGVKGGRYGRAPDLSRLDPNGNLEMTTDLRAYYATVLSGWLGVDADAVLGGQFAPLPVFT